MAVSFSVTFVYVLVLCWEFQAGSSQDDVRIPPSILEPAFSTTAYIHSGPAYKFILHCNATGHPKPTYRWQRDGADIMNSNVILNSHTGTMVVERVTSSDEGVYTCLANNTWGTSVSQGLHKILVREQGFNPAKSRQETKVEGNSFSVECRNTPPMTPSPVYKWYTTTINSVDNADAANKRESKRFGVDETGTMHLAYVKKTDQLEGKEYACALENPESNSIFLGSKVQLTVVESSETFPKSKPRSLYHTRRKTALIGTKVELECFFGGNPEPNIKWMNKYNKEITNDEERFTVSGFGRRLEIVNVTQSDEGDYSCEASNGLGNLTERTFLNITSKPIWVDAPRSRTVIEGSDVTFTCSARSARGEAEPSAPIWYQNGVQLSSQDPRIISPTMFKMSKVSRDNDLMNIQCMIQNEFGSIFQDCYLNVLLPVRILSRPPAVIELSYGDNVTLSISADTDPSRSLVYRWKQNGNDILSTKRGITFSQDFSNVTIDTSLVRMEEMETLLGLYTCYISHDVETVVVDVNVRMPATTIEKQPVTEGIVTAESPSGSVWIIAVVLGLLLLIGSAFLIACFLRHRYPKRVYLLEKKELKNKLDPVQDLHNEGFQTL